LKKAAKVYFDVQPKNMQELNKIKMEHQLRRKLQPERAKSLDDNAMVAHTSASVTGYKI